MNQRYPFVEEKQLLGKSSKAGITQTGKSAGGLLIALSTCLVLASLSIWSFTLAVGHTPGILGESFGMLAVEGLFFAALILIKYEKSGIYCFEPFTIVTVVIALVYFIAPLFQFAAGSTSRYGVDVSKYCMPATLIVMVGYLSFFLFYEFRLGREREKSRGVGFSEIEEPDAKRMVRWAYMIWVIAYFLNLFYYITRGFDITYIVLGGLTGAEDNSVVESSLAFLAYTKFILLGAWMMIYAYGKNRIIKWITYGLMLLCMFLGGGRSTLLIALLAPIVFDYAIKKKSPKFSSVVACVIALIFLFAFMQIARVGLRSGIGVDMGGLSLGEIFNPFYAEIDDFKAYYALLGVVPEKHGYLFGSEMIFYSLVLLIPRAVFPGKPDPAVHEIVGLCFGDQAVVNGVAYPALGEYYIEFGVFGVIVLMALLGTICRHLRSCYLETKGKSIVMMAYAIVYPSLISIVIRGYFPQNFSMLLFLLAPLLMFWLLSRESQKKKNRTVVAGEN